MRLRAPSTPRKGPSSRVASVRPYALAGGTLAVGFGGLYLAGLLAAGGDIEDGTTVRGVDIGGLSRAEAVHRLDDRLAPAAARSLRVTVGDREGTVDPRRLVTRTGAPSTMPCRTAVLGCTSTHGAGVWSTR